jgi:hypothetical protein
MAVKMLVVIFWTVTQCSLLVRYQHFGGTYCLGTPEDGGGMLHQIVGNHLQD